MKQGDIMLKMRLLPAICGVALLAAVPAFAQSQGGQSQGGMSGGMSQDDSIAGSGRGHTRSMQHSARSADSETSAIDQLNAQSLQSARQGQNFSGTGGGGMSSSGSSGMSGSSSGMPSTGGQSR
jgi:hypothetical protein